MCLFFLVCVLTGCVIQGIGPFYLSYQISFDSIITVTFMQFYKISMKIVPHLTFKKLSQRTYTVTNKECGKIYINGVYLNYLLNTLDDHEFTLQC
jgi:biotin transporter BioY